MCVDPLVRVDRHVHVRAGDFGILLLGDVPAIIMITLVILILIRMLILILIVIRIRMLRRLQELLLLLLLLLLIKTGTNPWSVLVR